MQRVIKSLFLACLVLLVSSTVLQSQKKEQAPTKNCRLDADDDGINDCFDQCPNTPKGVRVDTKGCPRDTDGDGIPDFKDKQLITPTECQPADTNGIGNCNRIK